jgi:divalent metal cation (Fe/Co/Zn/Cd) transporter
MLLLNGYYVSVVDQAAVIGLDALKDLSDAPTSDEETDELRKTCLNVRGVKSVIEIRARKSGPFLFVEVEIGVLGTISASAAHRQVIVGSFVAFSPFDNYRQYFLFPG